MTHGLRIPAMLALLLAPPAWAQSETSVITVPVTASLDAVAAHIDARFPNPIHEASRLQVCVEAQKTCTEIPEFRGFRIYARNQCIEVVPRIRCTLDERIDRQGPVRLEGKDDTLFIRQDIAGSVTATGSGEIDRHVRQTARASAEFTITAAPYLKSDWTLVLDPRIEHRWIDRPGFRLFNLIDVGIGSHVEPALLAALADVQGEGLDEAIERLDLRGQAADLWRRLQEPIPLDAVERTLWLHVRPSAIGVMRPLFDGGSVKSALSITARLHLDDTASDDAPEVPLPPLTGVPEGDSRIALPVAVGYDTIDALLAGELPHTVDFKWPVVGSVAGSVEIRGARLSRENGDDGDGDGKILRIALDLEAALDDPMLRLIGGAQYDGRLDILAEPVLDPGTRMPGLRIVGLSSNTAPRVARALERAVMSGPLGSWARSALIAGLDAELAGLRSRLNDALDREIAPGLRLEGAADLHVSDLRVGEAGLVALLRSQGTVQLVGFDPLRAD